MGNNNSDREELSLSNAAHYLLEECRMVLPGMQALFGFQLIAVFSDAFSQKLGPQEQILHLAALGLVAISIGCVMSPAAIHRHSGGRLVTDRFMSISTVLLLWSMYPLSIGICIDFYLIARIITGSVTVSLALAVILLAIFVLFWFLLPRKIGRKHKSQ